MGISKQYFDMMCGLYVHDISMKVLYKKCLTISKNIVFILPSTLIMILSEKLHPNNAIYI